MRYISRGIWIGVLAVSLTSLSLAQSNETGFPAFSSQAGGQWDSVNLANLNVHIAVPIFSRPGRGQKFGYGLSYDSTVYSTTGSIPGTGAWLLGFGWTGIGGGTGTPIEIEGALVGSILLARQNPETCSNQSQGTQTHFLTYIDPNQTAHPFTTEIVLDSCTQTGGTTTTSDDSGYTITIAYATSIATVTNRSGKVMVFPVNGVVSPSIPATVTDTNGNRITFDGTTITDTLGTTPLTASGSYPNPFVYQFPNSLGTTSTITVSYVNPAPAIQTEFQCPGNAFFGPPLEESIPAGQEPLVDKITLPDGSTYQFTYEPTPGQPSSVTGRLASVKVPTGATISYQYLGPNDGVNCNDGTTTTLKRTTSDGTWTYSRVISGANVTTTVTDPQNNQTVINFLSGTETERQIYQGSSASGTLLQTVFTCYNGARPNCNNTAITFPITEVSKFIQVPGAGENEQDTFLDGTTGRIQEMDEYDFGSSQPGPLLRKTVVGYAPLGNNISDHPSSMTICKPGGTETACGGTGTRVAQTTFAYDEGSVISTSGITQHVAVSGSRGNQTSVHRWLNTTGGTLDTTNSFDDTGNIVSTTDPGGHISSFTFNECNGAFATQTNLPDTQTGQTTVHHKTSATYDCNTGLLATATDQNLNVTRFFYDNMFRPTETDYPDLGQTLISYPDPNHVTVQRKIDSSRSTSSTAVLDGYGRISRIATANGEATPYDQQDSCYDGNGRLSFRSYTYQANSPNGTPACPNVSEAGDSFAYDALGRPTQTTHSDGTSSATTYNGLAIQITDEGNGSFNVSRIVQNDGLGRAANVCELYTGAALLGNGGTPASCGLNIAGTGFLTTYGYDTLDNLISVTQGALTSRTYAYDSVSRLTSETTPEAGTVSYTYNADSLLATRARPAPNQTNPAVTTTTNYQYDPLHRPTGRTYSGDPTNTPAPIFNYDETNVWGMSLTNTVGLLSSESIGVPSSAGQVFSYDPMGRSKLNAQCTPNTCNASPFAPYTLSYQYDLLGDVVSAGNGVGVTFSNSFNIAGRLTGVSSSLNDSSHPATLLSGSQYSPSVVTDVLGNGVAETTNFSPRGLLTSYTGAAPGGQPGTGSVIISGTLQTYQQQTQAATPASVTVTLGGSDSSNSDTVCTRTCHTFLIKDSGTIQFSINVGGTTVGPVQASYNGSSTLATLATALFQNFPANSLVTMSNPNGSASFTLTTTGTGTISNTTTISASVTSSCQDSDTIACAGPGWTISPSQGNFSGGQNAVFQTVYDNGFSTITVNNHFDTYPWSGSATTAASIAQGLCNTINGDSGSLVTASTNGVQGQCPIGSTTLTLASKLGGQNYSLGASSSSVVNSFSTTCPGFANCTSASLTGGGNPAYTFTLAHAADGQITSANDFVNGNWAFGYDQFNRLVSSNKNSGQQTFGYLYDRYGNRWQQNAPQGGPAPQYMFDNSNHFIGSGVTFDAAGNVLTDGLGNSFTWDAEGRLIQVKQGNTVTATYSYDADGRRVHGPNGEYVYDLNGHMITQIALNGVWAYGEIYAAGRHLATYSGGTTNFLHGDWLGTKRVMTALNGTTSETCTGLPFGDGVNCVGTNWTFNGFTDDIHDPETNLEHTLFRQYSGTQGRWLIPDPAGLSSADPMNPQTWNRYAYVMNNPGNAVDPTGMDACDYVPCGFDFLSGLDDFFNNLIDAELYQLGTVLWTDSPMGSLQGPSFGFSGFNVQDILQNILRDAIPIDACPPGGFECPDDGRPLFGTPSCGPFCVMDATQAPTKYDTCIAGFYNTGVGQAVKFWSPLTMLPKWNPENGKSIREWGLLIGKGIGLFGGQGTSGPPDIGSLSGVTDISTNVDYWLKKFGKIGYSGMAIGSLVDTMAHLSCSGAYNGPPDLSLQD